MATTSSKSPATPAPQNPANIITALGNAFQSQNGEPITGERIAQLLAQNMGQLGELARQGKLNPQQIQQVRAVRFTDVVRSLIHVPPLCR